MQRMSAFEQQYRSTQRRIKIMGWLFVMLILGISVAISWSVVQFAQTAPESIGSALGRATKAFNDAAR
jgi:hypothetical protein